MTRAKGPRHSVPFRRRREKKTDYHLRRRIILSGRPRLVIRSSTKHTTVQIVEAHPESDVTLVSSHSGELSSFGWRGSTGNLPAAYLTGLLFGLRAKSKGNKMAVLDVGVKNPLSGSRIYAALKGVLDGGLTVPHGDEVLPSEDRIRGEHISSYGALLSESEGDAYRRRFSRLLSLGIGPEKIPELFDVTRSRILESFGEKT